MRGQTGQRERARAWARCGSAGLIGSEGEHVAVHGREDRCVAALVLSARSVSPRVANRALAGRLRGLKLRTHALGHGGPRGCAPGGKDSMHTMLPRPHCGHSASDTPVSCQ